MAKHDKRFKYQSEADKPVMLSLRVPRELNDRLERYASEHRQKVSELVRDAIEMRLEVDADPRSRRAESTTEEERQIDGASLLRDMQATLARHETQMEALMQAIERQTTPAGHGQHDGVLYAVIHNHTDRGVVEPERPAEPESASDTASMDTTPAVKPTVLQTAQNPALASVEVPAYDPTKHHLDSLCKRAHEWGSTGQSLRNADNQCLECRALAKREKDAKKRAERERTQESTT